MKPANLAIAPVLHLLHAAGYATLATHSQQLTGYPYASVLPYVLDECQRPLILVSALAEHTRNLLADARISLSIVHPDAGNVQSAARVSLLGQAKRIDVDDLMRARYLRYELDAEAHLALDFMFFRIEIERLRYIAGIGRMGWLGDEDLQAAVSLPLAREQALIEAVSPSLPDGIALLGVDAYGIDVRNHGTRRRLVFDAPGDPAAIDAVMLKTAIDAAI